MTFTDAIKTCFSKYATFQGRAARPEFWYFALFVFLGNFLCGLIDRSLFGTAAEGQPVSILGALFSLAIFLPWIAVGVRRLHDVDKSGWWYLLILIPIIGTLVLLYFVVQRSTDGPNDYGPKPKRAG